MITKETTFEKIEIFEDGKARVREITNFVEDGKIIGSEIKRKIIEPGDDFDKEQDKIKNIINVVHTTEVINKYKEKKQKTNPDKENNNGE